MKWHMILNGLNKKGIKFLYTLPNSPLTTQEHSGLKVCFGVRLVIITDSKVTIRFAADYIWLYQTEKEKTLLLITDGGL